MPLSGDALDRSFVPSDMVAPAINLLQRLQAVQGALA
jgi:hypothetical protein